MVLGVWRNSFQFNDVSIVESASSSIFKKSLNFNIQDKVYFETDKKELELHQLFRTNASD